ncbi:MAG: DUF2079 domain-containing protein [Candidatus Alcyoniella australis]|nr:DUF2079 domain-containing protein [Candidatus Alcyoniella australis]
MDRGSTSRAAAVLLIVAIVAHTIIFSWLLIDRHRALVTHDPRDEAVNNQIIWHTAHGNPVLSTIKGNMRFHGHFRPVFFVAALPWLVWPHASSYYFATSLTIALGALWVFKIARRKFLSDWQALGWSTAFLLFLPLNEINLGNYDPEVFAILPLVIGFDLYLRKRLGLFMLAAAATLACKENLGIVLVGYSLHAMLSRRGLKWVLLPGLVGAGWMAVCIKLIIPLYYPMHNFVYLRFLHEQPKLSALVLYVVTQPLDALARVAWAEHLDLARRVLRSAGYLPLFSPLTLVLALPTAALVFLQYLPVNARQTHLLTGAVPFVFLAALLGARWISDRLGRLLAARNIDSRVAARGLCLYVLLSSLLLNFGSGIFGLGQDYGGPGSPPGSVSSIYDGRNFLQTDFTRKAAAALAQIDDHDSVMTNDRFLLALSERAMVWEIGTAVRMPRPDVVLINLTGFECHNCTYNPLLPGHLEMLADWAESGEYQSLCVDQEIVFMRKNRGAGRGDPRPAALLRVIAEVRRQELHQSLAAQAQLGWRNISQGRP